MVKGRLNVRKAGMAAGHIVAGHKLVADVVDAGHVLAFHGAEVVPHTGSEAHVAAVVLDNVADVLHPACTAPVAQLSRKVPAEERGHRIHIGHAQAAVRPIVPVCKKKGQIPEEISAVMPEKLLFQFLAPGQGHAPADGAVPVIALGVVEAGLV